MIALKPLSLSFEHLKLDPIRLNTGEMGFEIDVDMFQFYNLFVDMDKNNSPKENVLSVLDAIRALPLNSSLHAILHSAININRVDKLPLSYDGYVAYGLPPCGSASAMYGMEQR